MEIVVKRKSIIAGLTVLLLLVVLAALAGPASAQKDQQSQWTYFESTFSPSGGPVVHGMPWPLWKVGDPLDPLDDFVPVRSIDERWEGTYTATYPAEDGHDEPIPELSGYMVVETSGTMTVQGGVYTFHYQNRSTLYVGASEPPLTEDDCAGVWEITAIGTWRLDPTSEPMESQHLEGQGHGVAGVVKGWAMKFTSDIASGDTDAFATGYYLAKK
jgi:hypothetical protein